MRSVPTAPDILTSATPAFHGSWEDGSAARTYASTLREFIGRLRDEIAEGRKQARNLEAIIVSQRAELEALRGEESCLDCGELPGDCLCNALSPAALEKHAPFASRTGSDLPRPDDKVTTS